jgi:putative spermidine/putrescine transport system permease protein
MSEATSQSARFHQLQAPRVVLPQVLPQRQRSGIAAISFRSTAGGLAGVALFLLAAPTLIVVIVSFTSGLSLRFPPPGLSLRWYQSLADSWQLQFAARNSLMVGVLATSVSVLLGVPAALAIGRGQGKMARALDQLFLSPLILPGLAFGLASLIFFTSIGLTVSVSTLVIGHTIVSVPYVVRNTIAALAQLDPAQIDSSLSLGASRLMTFRRVTLPSIRSGILSGAFVCFMASFDNIPVSLFLRDAATDMLPVRMWQDLEGRLDVTIAAASSALIILTIALAVVMERLVGLSRRLQ